MRFLALVVFIISVINICTTSVLHAQKLIGMVKGDSAFVQLSLPDGETPESVAQKWGIGHRISEDNTGKLLLPVANIIRHYSCEGCLPLYHNVGKSEGLYRIGKWYGNIHVARLKELNQLRNESLQFGQRLLVGYIMPGTAWQPQSVQTITEPAEKPIPADAPLLTYEGLGFFMSEWEPPVQEKKALGKACSFKSESGWSDGKFYLLHNQYSAGTIVKVTHADSGKYLFAKVVGPLPELKMNHGLVTRLNNAAAASLGIWDESVFDVIIGY